VAFFGHFHPIWHDITVSEDLNDKYSIKKALMVTKKVIVREKIYHSWLFNQFSQHETPGHTEKGIIT